MSLKPEDREQVRQRAALACEFCGVHETDTGAALTIDHYQPKAKGGSDDPDNLIYCCTRCNQHKLDYWPAGPGEPSLWNPRREGAGEHFLELDDGKLQPLTPTGVFTLRRLRLNRPQLVACRLGKRHAEQRDQELRRYQELNEVLEKLLKHQTAMMERLWRLLEEQRDLLRKLFEGSPR